MSRYHRYGPSEEFVDVVYILTISVCIISFIVLLFCTDPRCAVAGIGITALSISRFVEGALRAGR
jgi:hypothetical protein